MNNIQEKIIPLKFKSLYSILDDADVCLQWNEIYFN